MWTTLTLRSGTDSEIAWTQLEQAGWHPVFSQEEDDGSLQIILDCPPDCFTSPPEFVKEVAPYHSSADIDWEAQWQAHGYNYHDGYVHYAVAGQTLRLAPGAGFGDLSHPTTHLALQLLTPAVKDKIVLDIGCGSGVLSLAAAALGAAHAYGVDIDPAALEHARANAKLNQLEENVTFVEIIDVEMDIIVINMIWSEQELAWQAWEKTARQAKTIVVSGLLRTECERYVASMTGKYPWRLEKEISEGEWAGLLFGRT